MEAQARECGRLLARARSSDIADANVVMVARERGEVVVTSDQGDLTRLSRALGRPFVEIWLINDLAS